MTDDDEISPDELLEGGYVWLFRAVFLHSPDDLWKKDLDYIEPRG